MTNHKYIRIEYDGRRWKERERKKMRGKKLSFSLSLCPVWQIYSEKKRLIDIFRGDESVLHWLKCLAYFSGESCESTKKGHSNVPFLRLIFTEAMNFLYEIAFRNGWCFSASRVVLLFSHGLHHHSEPNRYQHRKKKPTKYTHTNRHHCAKSTAHKYIRGQVARVTSTQHTLQSQMLSDV